MLLAAQLVACLASAINHNCIDLDLHQGSLNLLKFCMQKECRYPYQCPAKEVAFHEAGLFPTTGNSKGL